MGKMNRLRKQLKQQTAKPADQSVEQELKRKRRRVELDHKNATQGLTEKECAEYGRIVLEQVIAAQERTGSGMFDITFIDDDRVLIAPGPGLTLELAEEALALHNNGMPFDEAAKWAVEEAKRRTSAAQRAKPSSVSGP